MKSNKLKKPSAPGQPAEEQDAGGASKKNATAQASAAGNIELFGQELAALIDQHQVVKLDSTVDRILLRNQAAALRAKGFAFDAKQQVWIFQTS